MSARIDLWSTESVANYIGCHQETIRVWRTEGILPRFSKVRNHYFWSSRFIQKLIPIEWLGLRTDQIRNKLRQLVFKRKTDANQKRKEKFELLRNEHYKKKFIELEKRLASLELFVKSARKEAFYASNNNINV